MLLKERTFSRVPRRACKTQIPKLESFRADLLAVQCKVASLRVRRFTREISAYPWPPSQHPSFPRSLAPAPPPPALKAL